MKKFLPSHNFVRIVTFISILLFFFGVSVYDSPVYAKMEAMDEDSLSQVEGQEGISLVLNLTVSTVVTDFSFGNDLTSALAQSINVGTLTIGNGAGEGFGINTNLTIDVGTNATGTWLYLSGLVLPSNPSGIGISVNDISITANSTTWTLGNIDITGLYMGRSVTPVNPNYPNYIAGDAPWLSLSGSPSGGGGVVFYAGMGLYINNVTFAYATDSMNISGIYIYGASPNIASGTPASWPALTGNMQIGGVFNTYDVNGNITGTYKAGPATFNVGSNSNSTSGTEISLNLPMALSIRVADFQMDSTHDFGPMALDNLIIYRNTVTFRNL